LQSLLKLEIDMGIDIITDVETLKLKSILELRSELKSKLKLVL